MARPFSSLQKLGTGKFQKITNDLARGVPALTVARMIQTEWGDMTDIKLTSVVQQCCRLRLKMQEGELGDRPQLEVQSVAVARREKAMLDVATFSCLGELTDLALLLKARLVDLIEKEKKLPLPLDESIHDAVAKYGKLLLDLQKVRFDLGVDEFKGPVNTIRTASQTTINPDGSASKKELMEASNFLDSVFKKHGMSLNLEA